MSYKEISPYEISDNVFAALNKDWMLICAPDKFKECGANAMTASWGGFGVLWNKPGATRYVRPQRYTFDLMEDCDRVSLSFFEDSFRDALKVCGTKSGRDMDKLAACGMTASEIAGVPVINEARLTLVCKKLYADDIKKDKFTDDSPLACYPKSDFHRFYICEIEKVLIKE